MSKAQAMIPKTTLSLGAMCALAAFPLGARMVAYEPFTCQPGASMVPTLLPGEHFVAERVDFSELRRGDVVVLRNPNNPSGAIVKRVVALGGDEVWVHDGTLQLNGRSVPRCAVGFAGDALIFLEALDGRPYLTAVADGSGVGERCTDAPCRVPAGELFAIGDNRDNSLDSRTFGSIAARELLGRARWMHGPDLPADLIESYGQCLAQMQ